MKFNKKFMVFAGIMIAMLCVKDANALTFQCPEGCFCLGDGEYNDQYGSLRYYIEPWCNSNSSMSWDPTGCYLLTYGQIELVSNSSCGLTGTYYGDQFSELYYGLFGFYGFLNNEFVYGYRPYTVISGYVGQGNFDVLQCPYTHPHSEVGANKIADCFKYDVNGDKIYYGSHQTITCAAGTYLPADATVCAACSTAQNHVCSGGHFEKKNKIQGLKVNCQPGQYLPANATQCTACDTNLYLCAGGIYKAGEIEAQGRVKNNGYIFNGNHSVMTCQPGYFVPAHANQCVKCTDVNAANYACPGGVFHTGGQYQFNRGGLACVYGHPNSDHTECVATSTSPSFMMEKMSEIVAQQNQLEMSTGGQPQPTSQQLIKPIKKGNQRLPTFKTVQQMQPVQTVQPTQTTQTASTTESDTEMTEQQKKLELAKKLISAGVAAPVMQ